jgi:uncharacterized protein YjbJ (UPF0337 family)
VISAEKRALIGTAKSRRGVRQPSDLRWRSFGITDATAPASQSVKEAIMNSDQLEGSWEIVKGKIQAQWGKLTNDDLDVIEGNRKEIAGRIQQRYGYAKDRAEREINAWLKTF